MLATLVERGVSVDDPAFMERSPLLLVLSDGNGLSTQGSMAQRPFAARMLTAAKILADAGASLTEAMIESAPPEMLPLLVRGDSG